MPRRTLANLSDNVLLSRLHALVKQEKQTTLSILLHLAEVSRRDLYLAYGFSSLYDYCVGALGYSRSAAGRRIASARCLRRFPEVYTLLESGEVNLSTIGLVAPILNEENKDLLLLEIRNKTQQQVETIVAQYKPPGAYRDRVKPVRVLVPELGQNPKNSRNSLILNSRCGSNSDSTGAVMALAFDANHADSNRENGSEGGNPTNTSQANESANTTTPPARRTELGFLIQFLANEEFMAKLEEVKALLSNKMPNGTFENVFDALMNEFIDRHSHTKRAKRKEQSKQSEPVPKKQPQTPKSPSDAQKTSPQKRTRHIPAALRDKVFTRDNARCTYVGKNGKRCGSTHSLQIDHIKPFARGGQNTLSNLRLLCGKHNRHEAKRILGIYVMNQYNRRE